MAVWINNMGLAKGSHLVPGSTLMPKWEDRSGISIVQNNVNLLPKNKPQDPMLTKGPVFELAGKLETYNIHPGLYKQLVDHNYFKSLFIFDTFEKVVDMIYDKVTYVEPWASRGDTTPSSAWIFLLKLFTLRLSEEQVRCLLEHGDSPYLRAMGALYVRYGAEQTELWRWLGEYADDLEEFAPSTDPHATMTFGSYCIKLMTDVNYYNTTLPMLNVGIQRLIKVYLVLHDELVQRARKNSKFLKKVAPGAKVRAIYDDYESEPKWFDAKVDSVIQAYDGAPEGTWPTYKVTFAHGPKGRVKLGQIDLKLEDRSRSRSRERRRRSESSESGDDRRRHKKHSKKSSRRRRHRSAREEGEADEPVPEEKQAPTADLEGESVLAGRDIIGAVLAQERSDAVTESKTVIRSRPVSYDTSLITPASQKCATYRRRSRSRDRMEKIVQPLLVHMEHSRQQQQREKPNNADDDKNGDDRRSHRSHHQRGDREHRHRSNNHESSSSNKKPSESSSSSSNKRSRDNLKEKYGDASYHGHGDD